MMVYGRQGFARLRVVATSVAGSSAGTATIAISVSAGTGGALTAASKTSVRRSYTSPRSILHSSTRSC
jgi:hypothetical protein